MVNMNFNSFLLYIIMLVAMSSCSTLWDIQDALERMSPPPATP
jgi:hypothetical protein